VKKHPYMGLSSYHFWKSEPGIKNPHNFDPVVTAPFRISPEDRIVTAGSCFAQHVAKYLSQTGYNHHITEPAHPIFSDEIVRHYNYGMFSARYGNIYTTRQLKQLFLRAYDEFVPLDDYWLGTNGNYVDPFRPQIQPGGFASVEELREDREQHLFAVRKAMEELDVFVFTLGLTESWQNNQDGSIYPLAPGVAGGAFEETVYSFKNFSLSETETDLLFCLEFLKQKNPDCRILLTVSPVPLNATYEPRHVFVSTTISKAILRLAAERMTQIVPDCGYFPSYEIITSPHVRARYFAEDCRQVTLEGVEHVMGVFLKHFGTGDATIEQRHKEDSEANSFIRTMENAINVLCDEEAISDKPGL